MPWYIIALICFDGLALILYTVIAISAIIGLATIPTTAARATRIYAKLFCYGVLIYPIIYFPLLGLLLHPTDHQTDLLATSIPAGYIGGVALLGYIWKKTTK